MSPEHEHDANRQSHNAESDKRIFKKAVALLMRFFDKNTQMSEVGQKATAVYRRHSLIAAATFVTEFICAAVNKNSADQQLKNGKLGKDDALNQLSGTVAVFFKIFQGDCLVCFCF